MDVRLKGRPTTYTSNHDIAFWTINRDGPAATTVELPRGTTARDVASISVRRVPLVTDNGATLTVTAIDRAFFLRRNYLPRPSFVHWHGSTMLTRLSRPRSCGPEARPNISVWPCVRLAMTAPPTGTSASPVTGRRTRVRSCPVMCRVNASWTWGADSVSSATS